MASANVKALRAAFRDKLGDVKKRARRIRAEYLIKDDDDDEKEVEIEVKKKAKEPDRDSPKKEEKESVSEKKQELREEVREFFSKTRKPDTGKVKEVIVPPSGVKKQPAPSSIFKKVESPSDKGKAKR